MKYILFLTLPTYIVKTQIRNCTWGSKSNPPSVLVVILSQKQSPELGAAPSMLTWPMSPPRHNGMSLHACWQYGVFISLIKKLFENVTCPPLAKVMMDLSSWLLLK